MVLRAIRRFFYSDDPEVKLATGISEAEARMLEELLANNGVRAFAKDTNVLSATYRVALPNNYDIWVKQSDLERAREVLGRRLEN
jgi:hypothetical protein